MTEILPFAFPKEQELPPRQPGETWHATEFHDALKAHGTPHGVFDKDRQLPYRG